MLPLLRRAALATPNAGEAGALAGRPVRDLAGAEAAGASLRAQGVAAVLVKGGHLGEPSDAVTDVLLSAAGVRRLTHPRLPGPSPRGTGCALATAVAVGLGRGQSLEAAVESAIAWLVQAIAAATDVGGERHLG
jgi:hydroxymethylpyrimidine/phosphomethylpyrimidine kinase